MGKPAEERSFSGLPISNRMHSRYNRDWFVPAFICKNGVFCTDVGGNISLGDFRAVSFFHV
jgi:hypothetical protein